MGPRFYDAQAVARALDDRALIERLRAAFAAEVAVPVRHHHPVAVPGASEGMLLLMPAWRPGGAMGVKIVTVFPDNRKHGLDSVLGTYLLLDAVTGAVRAVMDGRVLTLHRTGAASALASDYLSRADAATLLMVGAGALAPHLIRAHRAARPSLKRVLVWNRTAQRARELASRVGGEAVADLAAAVSTADIVSCATLSPTPLIRGQWLKPGTHLDLVGGFTPAMREADDDTVRRARIFVDTMGGALTEAGDLTAPLAAGTIERGAVLADLHDLARGRHPGRRSAEEITLFKSVGSAIEDLAAAELVAEAA
ncbi:MAG: ornithine cyclodeaminase family protein [Alphaproteobacteria bacterium]|nr:ornithine cyclodeaminase family protein [Alphaproteobacteria bacterium]